MSKSVDETVFDFFELLLHEEDVALPADSKTPLFAAAPTKASPAFTSDSPAAYQSLNRVSIANTLAPDINKQALQKLLSPVSHNVLNTHYDVADPVEHSTPASADETLAEIAKQANQLADAKQSKVDKSLVSAGSAASSVAELQAQMEAIEQPHAKEGNVKDAKVLADHADIQVAPATQAGMVPPSVTKDLQQVLDDEFQVLFFNVAGLTLAVPLVSLGGIVKLERINHIIGRPDWFLGVQTHREEQLNVVDTCAWVMPEKYHSQLAENVDYQYLVLLEGSNWGLTCESLVNAVKINKSQVNWRSKAGKRPWLAGVVKEQMCGILHVEALVAMLDAGLGCQDSIG